MVNVQFNILYLIEHRVQLIKSINEIRYQLFPLFNRLRPAPRRSELLILSFKYVVNSVSLERKTKFFLGGGGVFEIMACSHLGTAGNPTRN